MYFLYAQGIPILISVFVFLMDNLEPEDILLPNMGIYNCFVGSEFSKEKSFFQTSQFLYYYLIVIVLISFNIICFLVTAIHLNIHWHTMRDVQTRYEKENLTLTTFLTVIILVALTAWWIISRLL